MDLSIDNFGEFPPHCLSFDRYFRKILANENPDSEIT